MVQLHWTEVDGVCTVWADARRPLTATLLFRAGRIDETLPTAGHTHLLEHTIFSSLGEDSERHFGGVGGAFTYFGTTDVPEELAAFFEGVCGALRSLPGDRLEGEKQVLAAEAATCSYNFVEQLLVWRYGLAGYGLSYMPEFGLPGATLLQLHALAAQRFTAENAMLWLSGPPPAGLCLDLPRGAKLPVPRPPTLVPALPAWYVDDRSGGIAASAIVPRASAATLFRIIAERRLRNRLRRDASLSYAPSVSYEPLDGASAHLVFHADSSPERRVELADAFGEYFETLGDFDQAEVESARAEALCYWTGPLAPPVEDLGIAEMQHAAMDWILGHEYEPIETLAAGWVSVTADEVTQFGRDVQSGALLALPGEAELQPLFGQKAPPNSVEPVEGRQIVSIDAPVVTARLVHGADGVTAQNHDDSSVTVRYAELAGALKYDDGCLVLIGADAVSITVEPTLWRDGPSVCQEIQYRVPAHLLIEQGSRPADAVPQPATTRWQRVRANLTLWPWKRIGLGIGYFSVALFVPGILSINISQETVLFLLAFNCLLPALGSSLTRRDSGDRREA